MKILYVEDNPVDLDLTTRTLTAHDADITIKAVTSQADAFQEINAPGFRDYDLVLVDMHLRDGDGIAILSYIRGHSLPVAVIILTGQGDEETAVAALKAGADDYIVKRGDYIQKLPEHIARAYDSYTVGVQRQRTELKVLYLEHSHADIDLTIRHFKSFAPHIHCDAIDRVADISALLGQPERFLGYDVIMLDYRLPEANALEILKSIRLVSSDTPVVLVTGKGDEEIAVKALKLGAFDYVTKNRGYLHKLPFVLENAHISVRLTMEHRALVESEGRYRSLFENNHVVMLLIAPEDGRIIDANPAATDFYGWTREDLTSRNLSDLRAATPDETDDTAQVKLLGERSHIHSRHSRADGSVADVQLSGGPIQIRGETLLYLVVYDITERVEYQRDKERLQKQLVQSQKMKAISQLAGGIAHDFNNMLGIIFGNVTYLLNRQESDEELNAVLIDVKEGAQRAQNLTQQLLTFAKGGTPIKKASDLNALVRESADFVVRGSKSKCVFDVASDLWVAEVDEGQFNQVISNLVINADQAMDQGGTITIATRNVRLDEASYPPLAAGRYVLITVQDQGGGISEESLSSIFDPFFTTKQQGNGLGLAIVFSIINSHGGLITVASEPKVGTTFSIHLPATAKPIQRPPRPQTFSHSGQGRILVMDDEETIYRVADRMLTRMGYETQFAESGERAVALYQSALDADEAFDLVILDLTVPGGMGGLETIEQLRQIDPQVKAVVSSGYSSDPVMSKFEEHGFVGIIPKPYSLQELAKLLKDVLGS